MTVVLPAGVDDPASPSGGNVYDRQVLTGLVSLGRTVLVRVVPGRWPRPSAQDRTRLGAALADVRAGSVVLLDGLVACAAPDQMQAHARRLRLVVLVHLPLADETGLTAAEARRLDAGERQALAAARRVVATSTATTARVRGAAAGRVTTAQPGARPAPLAAPSPGGGRLLCVASLTPRKGQDVLVEALAEVTDLPWTLTFAGPLDRAPDFAAGVRRQACELGDRVVFTGALDGRELTARYADTDLLVLPSRAEPYGMVVTEALARGVPVIASHVGGLPEALGSAPDGRRPGLLVPPGDPPALARALRRWLSDPATRDAWRAAAQARRSTLPTWTSTVRSVAAALDAAERAG